MRRFFALLVLLLLALPATASDADSWAWYTPGPPISMVAVSTTSASTGTLAGAACYRVACSASVFFRVGTLPLTALTTDSILQTPPAERVCLRAGANGMAFIVATGTATCTVLSLAPSP